MEYPVGRDDLGTPWNGFTVHLISPLGELGASGCSLREQMKRFTSKVAFGKSETVMQQPPTPPCIYPFFRKRGKIPKNMGFSGMVTTTRPNSRARKLCKQVPREAYCRRCSGSEYEKVKTCEVSFLLLPFNCYLLIVTCKLAMFHVEQRFTLQLPHCPS